MRCDNCQWWKRLYQIPNNPLLGATQYDKDKLYCQGTDRGVCHRLFNIETCYGADVEERRRRREAHPVAARGGDATMQTPASFYCSYFLALNAPQQVRWIEGQVAPIPFLDGVTNKYV